MKARLISLLIVQLLFLSGYSQIKGIVVDKSSGKPVPFTNIWVENENIGVTSDEDGTFVIDKPGLENKYLIFSCVGYERSRFRVNDKFLKIELSSNNYRLREVVISPSSGKKSGSKPSRGSYYANDPWIVARFIPYTAEYDAKPYIRKISYLTRGMGKPGKYRIRIFSVNEHGEPGADLIQDQLIYESKTGLNVITINIEKYRLKIPSTGFFIGFEWLATRINRHQKISIYGQAMADKSDNWSYNRGKWGHTNAVDYELRFRLILQLTLGSDAEMD